VRLAEWARRTNSAWFWATLLRVRHEEHWEHRMRLATHVKDHIFFILLAGWDLRHQVLRPLLAYCTAPNDRWVWLWRTWWNEDWQEKPKYSEKTCPSTTLSTTNPTWPDLCANTGRRGVKPATNRLSYGAAFTLKILSNMWSEVLTEVSLSSGVWCHVDWYRGT
jgi:hypothetical protein